MRKAKPMKRILLVISFSFNFLSFAMQDYNQLLLLGMLHMVAPQLAGHAVPPVRAQRRLVEQYPRLRASKYEILKRSQPQQQRFHNRQQ